MIWPESENMQNEQKHAKWTNISFSLISGFSWLYYCINIYNFTVFIPSADYSDEGTYNIYMYSKSVSRHVHECVGSTFTRFVLLLKLFYFLFYLSVNLNTYCLNVLLVYYYSYFKKMDMT